MTRSIYGGRGSGCAVAVMSLIVIVFVAAILGGVVSYNTQHTTTVTVCSKERAATNNGAEYRVYTTGGTYVMKDSLIGSVRYNTADAYGRIKENTTYEITDKGWRIPFLSMFPNILKARVVATVQQAPVC